MFTFVAGNTLSVFWEKPGYYYFMNGWKFSVDQTTQKEDQHRKKFESESAAKKLGLQVNH
jgi:hypothetical protein